jgi:hypothetical protein
MQKQTNASKARLLVFAILILALAVLACRSLTTRRSDYPYNRPVSSGTPSRGATTDENLFEAGKMKEVVAAFEKEVGGPIRVLQLTIYPNFATLQAQDPNKPENVDEYTYRNGKIDKRPVKLYGSGKLEDNLFPISDVNFDAVSTLADEIKNKAREKDLEGAKDPYMIIKRNLPFTNKVILRLYLSGTRKNIRMEADAGGKVTKVEAD